MIVASSLPCLKAFIRSTRSCCARPARPGTVDAGAGRPLAPWHMAQLAASDCTPFSPRLGTAKLGGGGAGCWADAIDAAAAIPAAKALTARAFMQASLESRGAAAQRIAQPKTKRPPDSGRFGTTERLLLGRFHRLRRLLGRLRDVEHHPPAVVDVDRHASAIGELAEQQLVGERAADRVLDQARHRARAHLRIEAVLRQVLL